MVERMDGRHRFPWLDLEKGAHCPSHRAVGAELAAQLKRSLLTDLAISWKIKGLQSETVFDTIDSMFPP